MSRSRDQDACPGALSLHQAADGALARVRLPGGTITAAQLLALAGAAAGFASPDMELTSRGNIQIRAVSDADALAGVLSAAGLLPSATHERVRNILASPLSGRAGGNADVRGLIGELDAAIQAEPALARLSGRFWFGLDDGRGDISGLAPDVGIHVLDSGVAVLLAGRDTGVRISYPDVVATLVAIAVRFTAIRENAWRVGELDDPSKLLAAAATGRTWPPVQRPPVGWIEQDDGRIALGAAVPLGVLSATVAEYLAAVEAPIVVTPWRSVLLCDLDEGVADAALRVLPTLGLVFDENSPWLDVSACTGSPGCAHSMADVRAAATESALHGGPAAHYVGCERGCGSPAAGEVLVATDEGFRPLRAHP